MKGLDGKKRILNFLGFLLFLYLFLFSLVLIKHSFSDIGEVVGKITQNDISEINAVGRGWLLTLIMQSSGAATSTLAALNFAGIIGPTILIYMVPNFVKEFFMPIFRFYMGRFHVDKNKYPEQYRKYVRAGEESNLRKIRRVIWKIGNKCSNWEMVPKVETKTLLIGATEDKMHTTEMTLRVHEMLPNSEYVDLGTNKAAHEQPLVDIMKKFINEFE